MPRKYESSDGPMEDGMVMLLYTVAGDVLDRSQA